MQQAARLLPAQKQFCLSGSWIQVASSLHTTVCVNAWDPGQYLRFADHRSRPGLELLTRVCHANPTSVVDLGCGPGNLTARLAERWPGATVTGVDSSLKCWPRQPNNTPTSPGIRCVWTRCIRSLRVTAVALCSSTSTCNTVAAFFRVWIWYLWHERS